MLFSPIEMLEDYIVSGMVAFFLCCFTVEDDTYKSKHIQLV